MHVGFALAQYGRTLWHRSSDERLTNSDFKETTQEAQFIWDIPTDKKCRFYLTYMEMTGEITPRNWFSVIAMGREIEMTVEDITANSTHIDTGEIEKVEESSGRQSCRSGDRLTHPGVPDMRHSYAAVTPATPERRKSVIPLTSFQ
jgi:hypothetical protein